MCHFFFHTIEKINTFWCCKLPIFTVKECSFLTKQTGFTLADRPTQKCRPRVDTKLNVGDEAHSP